MITYKKGDATKPEGEGLKFIVHVCNNQGGWGRGFVLAVSRRWKAPEDAYRRSKTHTLGDIQEVLCERDITVINMVAQKGYGKGNVNLHRTDEPNDEIPLQFDALATCLKKVAHLAEDNYASIHMPRIGCGLGGAIWPDIETLVARYLGHLSVYVYDL